MSPLVLINLIQQIMVSGRQWSVPSIMILKFQYVYVHYTVCSLYIVGCTL